MLTASLGGELAGCNGAWAPLDGFEEPEVDACSAAGAVGRLRAGACVSMLKGGF